MIDELFKATPNEFYRRGIEESVARLEEAENTKGEYTVE